MRVWIGLWVLSLAGCSSWSSLGYQTMQGAQRQQCQKILDNVERERCLGQIGPSYEDYRRQTGDAR